MKMNMYNDFDDFLTQQQIDEILPPLEINEMQEVANLIALPEKRLKGNICSDGKAYIAVIIELFRKLSGFYRGFPL